MTTLVVQNSISDVIQSENKDIAVEINTEIDEREPNKRNSGSRIDFCCDEKNLSQQERETKVNIQSTTDKAICPLEKGFFSRLVKFLFG